MSTLNIPETHDETVAWYHDLRQKLESELMLEDRIATKLEQLLTTRPDETKKAEFLNGVERGFREGMTKELARFEEKWKL